MCDPLPWHVIYGHYLMSLLPLDQRHHVGEVWARLEQGESRYAPDKYFPYNSFLTFTFDIKNLFNVIKHTLLESSVYVKYGPKILNGQYAFFEKRDVYVVRFDLDPWTTIFFKNHCIPQSHNHIVREVWARFDQRGSRYASDKDFMYNCAMTSTLNLEKNWSRLHSLP